MALVKYHKELKVYQNAFAAAMLIFEITKTFPPEEKYSLTDQIRRLPDHFVEILLKDGEKENTQNYLKTN